MIRFILGVILWVGLALVLVRLEGDWTQVLKRDIRRKGGSRPRRHDERA